VTLLVLLGVQRLRVATFEVGMDKEQRLKALERRRKRAARLAAAGVTQASFATELWTR